MDNTSHDLEDAVEARIALLDTHDEPRCLLVTEAPWLTSSRHVGVMAGSYNPPTLAHIALADSAKTHARLDGLLWTISRVTVDKERIIHAPLPQRLITLAHLTMQRSNEAVALMNRGLYIDQAEAFHRSFPDIADLSLIMGYDKLAQIFDPRYYTDRDAALDRLFSMARILVAPRAHGDYNALHALLDLPTNRRWATSVTIIPIDPSVQMLSSSEVRERLRQGISATDLVPEVALPLIASGEYNLA
jgi:nicotinamide-nucleotide adenylyltransferase